jgi:hypothetical protein
MPASVAMPTAGALVSFRGDVTLTAPGSILRGEMARRARR